MRKKRGGKEEQVNRTDGREEEDKREKTVSADLHTYSRFFF